MTTDCKIYSVEHVEALHRAKTALARFNLLGRTILEKVTCYISTNKTRLTRTIAGYDRCGSGSSHRCQVMSESHRDDSDDDLRRDVRATGMDGRRSMGLDVEIWRTGSLLDVFLWLSSLLLFFGSRPSTNGVGTGFYHLRSQSSGGGFSQGAGSAERSPLSCTDRLWDL